MKDNDYIVTDEDIFIEYVRLGICGNEDDGPVMTFMDKLTAQGVPNKLISDFLWDILHLPVYPVCMKEIVTQWIIFNRSLKEYHE